MMANPFVIIVQGATAVGKSELAFSLAKALGGYIISADSRQIYKELEIGTAKPNATELEEVEHCLISEIDPRETFSAGEFARRADTIIAEKCPQVPIVVGGTGFYCKALLGGLSNIPAISDSAREKLANIKNKYARLQEVDPILAQKVHPNDRARIERGLLVYFSSQKPLSAYWEERDSSISYDVFSILLERERSELYQRINERFDLMVSAGLIEEIAGLLAKGYSWDNPGLNTVGYKEFRPYFEGKMKLQDCLEKAKQSSRNFAKRQITWYRKINFDLTLSAKGNSLPTVMSRLKIERPSLFCK